MASFFHAVTLHLFLLKYFLWRVQGFHVVSKNAAIPLFAFSASSPLLTLFFHSKKYLLTCHPGRTILWLRCKMVAVKSCSAFSHPVFSVVVVPALFQVHCLMFPKLSVFSSLPRRDDNTTHCTSLLFKFDGYLQSIWRCSQEILVGSLINASCYYSIL